MVQCNFTEQFILVKLQAGILKDDKKYNHLKRAI